LLKNRTTFFYINSHVLDDFSCLFTHQHASFYSWKDESFLSDCSSFFFLFCFNVRYTTITRKDISTLILYLKGSHSRQKHFNMGSEYTLNPEESMNTENQLVDSTLFIRPDPSFGNTLEYEFLLSFYDVKFVYFFFVVLQKNLSV
jgi:hypothetical protein